MIFAGIDPGLDGALVCINSDGIVLPFDTPTLQDGKRRRYNVALMSETLRTLPVVEPVIVALERVHSMPGQGVASSFSFGMGFGLWLGILAALNIPHQLITPQRWKKVMMDGQPKDKDASRIVAMQLFPAAASMFSLKKHHGRADALLLAEYLRRTHA